MSGSGAAADALGRRAGREAHCVMAAFLELTTSSESRLSEWLSVWKSVWLLSSGRASASASVICARSSASREMNSE